MSIPDTELGDLEILQVNQVEHDEAGCGPKFIVTIRNHSLDSTSGEASDPL